MPSLKRTGQRFLPLLLVMGTAWAQEARTTPTLAGILPRVVGAQQGPYLVTADIYVPSGKTVTIEPGTVLLFRNFVGLHVEGRLVAEGTREKGIFFTSELDSAFSGQGALSANAYDWNGITIHETGLASSLSHCTVRYSVFGINALTRFVKLDNLLFADNGRADVTIEGEQKTVTAAPFSHVSSIKDAQAAGVPVTILMDPDARKRNILRYTGLGLCVGGIAGGLWLRQQTLRDQERVDQLGSVLVVDENSPLVKNSGEDFERAIARRNADRVLMVGVFGVGLAAAVAFGYSFTF